MVKGSNRKMFRKPGMARRAIGILASSPELAQAANRNMPVRLQGGGSPRIEQINQNFVNSLLGRGRPSPRNIPLTEPYIYQGNLRGQPRREQLQNRYEELVQTGKRFANQRGSNVVTSASPPPSTDPFTQGVFSLLSQEGGMDKLYELRRQKQVEGFGNSPQETEILNAQRDAIEQAIQEGRTRQRFARQFDISEPNLDDVETTSPNVTSTSEVRPDAIDQLGYGLGGKPDFTDPYQVSVDDVINSERVSPLRPYGYEPGGLPEDSAFGTKTRKRLTQIEQVLADDDKADKDSKLTPTRREELQAELKELNRLDVGQDKLFRDLGIPEFSDKNYRDNESQIKQLDARIKSQERRRDRGIENKNEKLIDASNTEIARLTDVRDRALLDRQFMDAQKNKDTLTDEDRELAEVENNNALASALEKTSSSLLDPNSVDLNRAEDVDKLSVDKMSLAGGSPAAGITDINVVGKFIAETDDEVTPDDKENAKEILREQGQPPELADRPDFWHYVTMAGLGIAAGESDNALTNVAKGLLMGLDQKARDDKDYRKEGYERWLAGEKLNLEKQSVALTEKQLEIQQTRADTAAASQAAQLKRLEAQIAGTGDTQRFVEALLADDEGLTESEARGYVELDDSQKEMRVEERAFAKVKDRPDFADKEVFPGIRAFDSFVTVYKDEKGNLTTVKPKS